MEEEMMNHILLNEADLKASIYEWGNKDKPTIICLHGLGSSGLSFLEIAESIKLDYHILSIELPGHGYLYLEENDYEISNICEWVHKIICALELYQFFILAHSWGAQVMTCYADIYSSNVKGIILLDGGYHNKQLSYNYHKQNNDHQQFCFRSLIEEKEYYLNDFDNYSFDDWDQYEAFECKQYLRWNSFLADAAKDLMVEQNGKIVFRVQGKTACKALEGMYRCPIAKNLKNTMIPIVLVLAQLPESLIEERNVQLYEFRKYVKLFVVKAATTHMIHWDNPDLVINIIYKQFNF